MGSDPKGPAQGIFGFGRRVLFRFLRYYESNYRENSGPRPHTVLFPKLCQTRFQHLIGGVAYVLCVVVRNEAQIRTLSSRFVCAMETSGCVCHNRFGGVDSRRLCPSFQAGGKSSKLSEVRQRVHDVSVVESVGVE